MKLSEARRIAKEVDRRIVDVRVKECRGLRCVELLWKDGSTSLIPIHLFKGKNERERFREEVRQVKKLRDLLEAGML